MLIFYVKLSCLCGYVKGVAGWHPSTKAALILLIKYRKIKSKAKHKDKLEEVQTRDNDKSYDRASMAKLAN